MRQLVSARGWFVWGLLLLGTGDHPAGADIPQKPRPRVRVLPSQDCPMAALKKAVRARTSQLMDCVSGEYDHASVVARCHFDEKGAATACELESPSKKDEALRKRALLCVEKNLLKLVLPPTDKPGEAPSKCVAAIEVGRFRPPRGPVGPDRYYNVIE